LDRRQRADVFFLVKVRPDAEPEKVFVGGLLPLNPQEGKNLKEPIALKTPGPTGVFSVEQVLTTDTAPVRRLDLVTIGTGGAGGAAAGAGGGKALSGGSSPPAGAGSGPPAGAGSGPGVMAPGLAGGASGTTALSHRTYAKAMKSVKFVGDPEQKEGE